MNIRLIEGQGAAPDPIQDERDRIARRAALAALADLPAPEPLDTVGYRSAGATLVIGTRADALPWAERLAAALPVTVLLLDGEEDRAVRLYPVFAARDVFFFYVLFEAMLIPVYFMIGLFGGAQRRYAAVKFLLYSLTGGLIMLVAVIALYLQGPGGSGPTFGEKAIEVSAESLLYAGYAQHFLQTYFPAAYPRWYLDGFGQVFSTFAVDGEKGVEFGRAPVGTMAVMGEFGSFPVKDILNDAYLSRKPSDTRWTPIHAWMLTHFLLFSDTRRPQLNQYLSARAQGVDAETAAAIFGDQTQLVRELRAYFLGRKPYLKIAYDGSKIEQPTVRRLRESEAAFVKGRLELGARIVIPPAPPADATPAVAKAMTKARNDALAEQARWLNGLRRDAARWPAELQAQLLLAEAECRSGNAAECLSAARRAEAIAPNDIRTLVWKANAMVLQSVSLAPPARAAMLAEARRHGRPAFIDYVTFLQIWSLPPALRARLRDLIVGRRTGEPAAEREVPTADVH